MGASNPAAFTGTLDPLLPSVGENRVLSNLIPTADDPYTYIFDSNSQALDHVFVIRKLARMATFDVVHVNFYFPRVDGTVGSGHGPLLLLLKFGPENPDGQDDDEESEVDDLSRRPLRQLVRRQLANRLAESGPAHTIWTHINNGKLIASS